MGVLGVIPARFGATRLPGKPLADLGGRPLIAHVAANAARARRLDRVVVATDDPRVVEAVEQAGGEAVLTDPALPSGSDRVEAAARRLEEQGNRYEVVVNVQGDEPFLSPEAIDRVVELMDQNPAARIGTLAAPATPEEFERSQVVKVVVDAQGQAMYFSRAPIPHGRDVSAPAPPHPLRHVGIYAFRREYLARFVTLPPSGLELREGLEQLRALEDGAAIVVAVGNWEAMGIDTPEDLEEARRRLALR